MNFIELKLGSNKQIIDKDLIGRCSITANTCDECGMRHYNLDIYDRNGLLLCSFVGTEEQIYELSKKINPSTD